MNFWKYSQTNAIFNPKYDIAIFWFSTWPLNHNFFGNILEFLRILRFLIKYREKCIKHEPFGKLKKAQGRPRLHADAKALDKRKPT